MITLAAMAQFVVQHLSRLLSTGYGYLLIALTFLLNMLQPEWFSFAVVGGGVLVDLLCGIAAAVKLNKFVLSKAMRRTCYKLGGYSFMLVGVFLIERIIHDSGLIGIKLATALAAACELWSISASLLIIYPEFPFLKLFRLQLKGEIASKVGRNVDHILKEKE